MKGHYIAMKGKDIITHAVREEMPEMEQLRQNSIRQATKSTTKNRRKMQISRIIPVAACVVFMITLAIVLPNLRDTTPNPDDSISDNFGSNTSSNGFGSGNGYDGSAVETPGIDLNQPQTGDEQIITPPEETLPPPEFIGLPMDNHCLPQDVSADGLALSRFGVGSLFDIFGTPGRAADFWAERPVEAFGFVRVLATSQEGYVQTSTVEVLRSVWSRERELPETMTLTQFSGAIPCCTPYGELMRVGGVFLLPLWYNDGIDEWRDLGWYNWTYFDVLFEVDDNGLIWSRSNISAFNRFDGRHTSVLTNAILGIANGDENLGRDIAHTPFGWAADDAVLAIVTVVSSESELRFPGSPGRDIWVNNYILQVEQILSTPTPFGPQRSGWFEQIQRWRDNWQTGEKWWEDWEQDGEVFVVDLSFTSSSFEDGERYLVFIMPSYGDWSLPFTFFSDGSARINADGTITPVAHIEHNWNVFDEYSGYTVERLAELAHLANTWHERYAW